MTISRRDVLRTLGTTTAVGTLGLPGVAGAVPLPGRIKTGKETTTICPYCGVGCGLIVTVNGDKVVNTEGDPEHPISEGTLCSKGGTIYQVVNNENRLQKPRYRAPGSAEWKDVEWDWALDRIARRIKDTRDRTFRATTTTKIREVKVADTPDESGLFTETVTDVEKQFMVNRTDGIAHVGSAALDNEECYLIQKLVRSWGLVYVEHQARL